MLTQLYCIGTVTAYGTDEAGVPVKGANGKLQARCVVKVPKEDGIPDGMTIDRCSPPHPHTHSVSQLVIVPCALRASNQMSGCGVSTQHHINMLHMRKKSERIIHPLRSSAPIEPRGFVAAVPSASCEQCGPSGPL